MSRISLCWTDVDRIKHPRERSQLLNAQVVRTSRPRWSEPRLAMPEGVHHTASATGEDTAPRCCPAPWPLGAALSAALGSAVGAAVGAALRFKGGHSLRSDSSCTQCGWFPMIVNILTSSSTFDRSIGPYQHLPHRFRETWSNSPGRYRQLQPVPSMARS